MRATTTDFKTFSSAKVYIDTKFSVIDTTMVYDNLTSKFYRFSKDERPNGSGSGKSVNGKFIFEESSSTFSGPWNSIKAGIGNGVIQRGEGPLVFQSNLNPKKVFKIKIFYQI
jgi:hypothetical protein